MHGPAGIPETRFHFKTRSVEVWPRREHFALFGVHVKTHKQRAQKASVYNILGGSGSTARERTDSRQSAITSAALNSEGVPFKSFSWT
jgi:hypothetical protein